MDPILLRLLGFVVALGVALVLYGYAWRARSVADAAWRIGLGFALNLLAVGLVGADPGKVVLGGLALWLPVAVTLAILAALWVAAGGRWRRR